MVAPRTLLPLSLLVAACGGTVVFEEDGGDGGGGGVNPAVVSVTSGPGATGSSSGTGGGSSASSSVSGSGSVTNASASAASAGGGTSVGQGGSSGCAGVDVYADCLGAGECVPVFDDLCCSSCFPGECADCQDLRFVGCTDRLPPEPEGACGAAPCGFVPDWTCTSGVPDCSEGCFEAGCVQHLACDGDACEVWCDAVRPDACGVVVCDAPPPPCNGDQVPEVGGGCWTGACIPAWVCAPQPPLF